MGKEPAVLALLREQLEREVPGAAAILFEALGAWGPRVPVAFGDVVAFVHGPLRASLSARFGPERAAAVLRALERALRFAEQPTKELSRVRARPFDEETTTTLRPIEGSFDIAIVSRSGALAERVEAVLDAWAVVVVPIRSPGELSRAPKKLSVALVDAADLPPVDPDVLAAALAHVPLVLVWGSESPRAPGITLAFERAGVPVMTFARSAPVDPLIDVLRSRSPRAQRSWAD